LEAQGGLKGKKEEGVTGEWSKGDWLKKRVGEEISRGRGMARGLARGGR